jgi:Prokaryotic Cytochrome C oxidase subunit IV
VQKVLASSATIVWVLLLAATIASWRLGGEPSAENLTPNGISAIALVIAFFKVRLVLIHFMELKDAPWGWRAIYEAWVLLVCGALVFLYLIPIA